MSDHYELSSEAVEILKKYRSNTFRDILYYILQEHHLELENELNELTEYIESITEIVKAETADDSVEMPCTFTGYEEEVIEFLERVKEIMNEETHYYVADCDDELLFYRSDHFYSFEHFKQIFYENNSKDIDLDEYYTSLKCTISDFSD